MNKQELEFIIMNTTCTLRSDVENNPTLPMRLHEAGVKVKMSGSSDMIFIDVNTINEKIINKMESPEGLSNWDEFKSEYSRMVAA